MKSIITITCFIFCITCMHAQNVAIGTAVPNASAKLDITSTSSGFLPPRMTTIQRDAILSPAAGLTIFNTTTQLLEFYTEYGWRKVTGDISGTNKILGRIGSSIGYSNYPTADGGSIIAGSSSSDCIVIKLKASGDTSWIKYYGGAASDDVQSIVQTADGGYIMGGSSRSSVSGNVTGINHGGYDYWVVKLDAAGNVLWNKLLGGSADEQAHSIRQTSDGGYIIAGYSLSSASGDVTGTNHGQYDYWIVKLDAAGSIIWNKLLGGTLSDEANSIRQTSDGGYIIAGYSYSSANGDVTGTQHGSSADGWIVKLNGAGIITWNKLLGGTGIEIPQGILQTPDGEYVFICRSNSSLSGDVTVATRGGYDIWLVKLDAAGTIIWNKLSGGGLDENAYDLQSTADGGFIIAGSTTSSNSGNVTGTARGSNDIWIVKTDALGNITWNKVLGGSGYDVAYAIFQAADGSYHIAGSTNSSMSFDIKVDGYGVTNIWILRLDAFGNIL